MDGHHVRAFRGEGCVDERRNGDIHVRLWGKLTVLGCIEGTFEVVDARANVDSFRDLRKIRQPRQGQVHFGYRSCTSVVSDFHQKVRIQSSRIYQLEERVPGIGTGYDRSRGNLFSAGQYHTRGLPILHANARDGRIFTNPNACGRGNLDQRFGDRSGAALRKQGGSDGIPVGRRLQQDSQAGSRRPWSGKCAEDSTRSDRCPQQTALEPFRNQVRHGHRRPT